MKQNSKIDPISASGASRAAEVIHLLGLAAWMAALLTGALVAGIIFTTMRPLEPTFAYFSAFPEPQADLGAGFIQARVFLAADSIQFVGAALAILAFIVSVVARGAVARPSTLIRGTLLAAAVAIFSYHYFALAPRMQNNATLYWEAARAGQVELAHQHHAEFNADHPASVRVHGAVSIFVLATFVASAWSATRLHARRTPAPSERPS